MKLKLSAVSACAVAAGLLTLGVQKSQAITTSDGNGGAFPTQFKIVGTWADDNTSTGSASILKVRVTNKDMLTALDEDWGTTDAKGTKICWMWDYSDEMALVDPNTKQVVWWLTGTTGTLLVNWTYWFNSEIQHGDGSYKYTETGNVEWLFASNWDDWNFDNWDSNTLEFETASTDNYYGFYTYTERGSAPGASGKVTYTITESDSLVGEMYDNDNATTGSDNMVYTGTATISGTSKE